MHLLIVEDDKISLELLRRVIESDAKHDVTLASDGEEAWGMVSDPERKFDACIFDIFMPKMSGLDVVERMRATERYRTTPVILCTAVQDRATVRRAASLAITHYVLKPYSRALMLEKLRQVRAALGDMDVLEDPSVVCKRLGIEADMHRVMLKNLLDDIAAWSQELRSAADPAELQKHFIRGRGIKGSCLSLGALRIARQCNAIEGVLEEFLARPVDPFPREKVDALLADLDREIGRAGEQVKAAA